jgi:outer membrane receptor protein involved in Fe transport
VDSAPGQCDGADARSAANTGHAWAEVTRSVSVSLVLLAVTSNLTAQQPDSTRKPPTPLVLPPIEVVGSIRPFAGPAVGSGIPARVTTLAGRELNAYRPRGLSDLMEQQAGFSVYDDLGSPFKLNLSSRGFVASPVVGVPQGVSVFLDGVRMNEIDAAQVNFDLLPMEHVKRVELLSGNGSLLGRNSLGGAINLITTRGEGPAGGRIELSGGSFHSFRGEGNISGLMRNGVDYYAGGTWHREDGWRDVTSGRQKNLFLNLGKLGERSGIRFQALYAESRAETAGSLPESVYRVKPDSNLSANDYEALRQIQISASGYRQSGFGRASFITFVRHHRAERFNANQDAHPDAFGTARNIAFGYTADYRWATPIGREGALSVRAGVDGSVNKALISLFVDSTKFGRNRISSTRVRAPVWDLAPFALADLARGRVTVSAGARLDHVEIPFHNQDDPSLDTTGIYTRLNPRLGVAVDLGQGFSGYGSWGMSFRAPAVIENACADPERPCPLPFALGDDPPLKPVTAGTLEAGAAYSSSRAYVGLSAYRTNVRNDIFLTPSPGAPEGSTLEGYFINLDQTRRQGIELSVRVLPRGGHSVFVNYAYTLATFQSDAEIFSPRIDEELGMTNTVKPGSRLPLVPEHQLKGGVDLLVSSAVSLGIQGRHVGSQVLRGDEANRTSRLPAYFVADARGGVEVGRFEIVGIITNVFARKYASFGTFNFNEGEDPARIERFLTPGQMRAFRIVLRYSFGSRRAGGSIEPN